MGLVSRVTGLWVFGFRFRIQGVGEGVAGGGAVVVVEASFVSWLLWVKLLWAFLGS